MATVDKLVGSVFGCVVQAAPVLRMIARRSEVALEEIGRPRGVMALQEKIGARLSFGDTEQPFCQANGLFEPGEGLVVMP